MLYNKKHERFVNELLPRDVVTKAIHEEMEKDGTDYVWLSMEHIPKETILGHFPNIYQRCLEEGYDVTKECIPVVSCTALLHGRYLGRSGQPDFDGTSLCSRGDKL